MPSPLNVIPDWIKGKDAFGTPVTVNFRGEDTYKSCLGGICTLMVLTVVLIELIERSIIMFNLDDNAYATYLIPNDRTADDPLNLDEYGGQMYIGVSQQRVSSNGTITREIIPFEETYLQARWIVKTESQSPQEYQKFERCSDRDDFIAKVKYTSGLQENDFSNLVCIPSKDFELYNHAELNLFNEIEIVFSECGGVTGQIEDSVQGLGTLRNLQGVIENPLPASSTSTDTASSESGLQTGASNLTEDVTAPTSESQNSDDPFQCKQLEQIEQYFRDRYIVIYASKSYVAQEDQEPNANELITYLTPIVEKRLDFRQSKRVNTVVQEVLMEIQDSYAPIFKPDEQELYYTQTSIVSEDMILREQLYNLAQGSLSREPLLTVSFRQDTNMFVTERTAYDMLTLFGDVGGFKDFAYFVIAPIITMLLGSNYSYQLISSLYQMNDTPKGQPGSSQAQIKEYMSRTQKIKFGTCQAFWLNKLCYQLACRSCWAGKMERVVEIGQERLDNQLDVRSLVMTQNVLLALLRVVIKDKKKMNLLMMQRKSVIIETELEKEDLGDGDGLSGLIRDDKEDYYASVIQILKDAEYDIDNCPLLTEQTKELIRGTVRVDVDKNMLLQDQEVGLDFKGNNSLSVRDYDARSPQIEERKGSDTQRQSFDSASHAHNGRQDESESSRKPIRGSRIQPYN